MVAFPVCMMVCYKNRVFRFALTPLAGIVVPVKDIFSDVPACKLAILVVCPLRDGFAFQLCFKQLRIKRRCFYYNFRNRQYPVQFFNHRKMGLDLMLDAWSQPASVLAGYSIIKSFLPVAGLSISSSTTPD